MNDVERVLGELKEFKRWVGEDLKEIKVELKQIAHWRWKITGAMTVVIGAAELVRIFLDSK